MELKGASRIIVIDDEPDCRLQLSRYIRETLPGTEIRTACNGEEGWQIINEWKPHVVLSDINMPVMDGLMLLEHIRERYPAMQTIFFTGRSDNAAPIRALKLGAADFLLKPLDGEEVIQSIMHALSMIEKEECQQEYLDNIYRIIDHSNERLGDINFFLCNEITSFRYNRAAADSSNEKSLLLQEIHHRVKNNMQLLSSLLSLQSAATEDLKVLDMITQFKNRIFSMALIYEKLLESPDLLHIRCRSYITALINYISRVLRIMSEGITIESDIEDVEIDIATAIPCGLVMNEILTNSIKHAFPEGRSGTIRVSLKREGGNYVITAGDDGIGLPEFMDIRKTRTIGLQLVTLLAEDQLGGIVELRRTGGTEFRIIFKATARADEGASGASDNNGAEKP